MENLTLRLKKIMDAFPAKTALYCVDLTTGTPIAAIRETPRLSPPPPSRFPLCAVLFRM